MYHHHQFYVCFSTLARVRRLNELAAGGTRKRRSLNELAAGGTQERRSLNELAAGGTQRGRSLNELAGRWHSKAPFTVLILKQDFLWTGCPSCHPTYPLIVAEAGLPDTVYDLNRTPLRNVFASKRVYIH